jgi:uncharacterized membrane protein YraQ (UPF0718 family)
VESILTVSVFSNIMFSNHHLQEGKLMQQIRLYLITALLVIYSYFRSKNKTQMALRKAWKAFENILPQFLGVILLVGVMMAVMDPETISAIIGESSGWTGVFLASIAGSVTLIPGFVAFPTAALLLDGGAGLMQVAAFISSLMMVGVITFPIEVTYFGRKAAFLRNSSAFIFSFIVAWIIGLVVL